MIEPHGSLCVHIVHQTKRLSDLVLVRHNMSGAISTLLPQRIQAGGDAWFAIRDGVVYVRSARPGQDAKSARIDPFQFAATYREETGAARRQVDVRLELRRKESLPPTGERQLSLSVHTAPVRVSVSWAQCALIGTAVISDGEAGVAAISPANPSRGTATSLVDPSNMTATLCTKRDPEFQPQDRVGNQPENDELSEGLSLTRSACQMMAEANASNAVHVR